MTTPEMTELVERGRAFRVEAITPDFEAIAGQLVPQAPDVVLGQYALGRYHHISHASNLQVIQSEGLKPGSQLFEPEHETFFRQEYAKQQQRCRQPFQDRIVDGYIFGRTVEGRDRGVFLTGIPDTYHSETFAVPERMKYFLRNMQHLSKLPEASREARQTAASLVDEYCNRLVVDDKISAAEFSVDPRSPQLARSVIGGHDFSPLADDVAFCASVAKVACNETMIEVNQPIPPEYLSLQSVQSYDAAQYLAAILASDGQVVFRPVERY